MIIHCNLVRVHGLCPNILYHCLLQESLESERIQYTLPDGSNLEVRRSQSLSVYTKFMFLLVLSTQKKLFGKENEVNDQNRSLFKMKNTILQTCLQGNCGLRQFRRILQYISWCVWS